jgi:K+-transporting ATPase ATPase A chain
MDSSGLIQIVLYLVLLTALTPIIGEYMARVFSGGKTVAATVLGPLERGIYRVCGVDPAREQHWTGYAASLLAFNLLGVLLLYAILRLQAFLPLNPAEMTAMTPDLAFNTAVSFTTNTNWQSYSGEAALSYLSQMAGLTVQNFVSAATGMAVLMALIRGFSRRSARTIGNFWVDMVRAVLYVLLPLSIVTALFLVWQGVPQNLDAYVTAQTVEGAQQVIAQGPAASQIAIKQIGSNGGGFFGINSAHPYENPTPLSNLMEMLQLLLIASGLTWTFGRMVGDLRQGVALFAAMGLMLVVGIGVTAWAESRPNPAMAAVGADSLGGSLGGNMEGKEIRFGIANSALWAVATTAASNGSVNSMHDSFSALGGMVPMVNMMLGEVVFGGVGAGLYGMMVYVLLAVFIAGLMVGRTPEYLGKKIEAKEIKLAMFAALTTCFGILVFSALALVVPAGLAGIQERGPHGLSEVLYAYSSATGNNGSAFGGYTANAPYPNSTIALAILLGRFLVILPVLAIAGTLAAKKSVPTSAGTFPTHGPLFVGLLVGTVVIVGGLTFFPALSLGPIAEHLITGVLP